MSSLRCVLSIFLLCAMSVTYAQAQAALGFQEEDFPGEEFQLEGSIYLMTSELIVVVPEDRSRLMAYSVKRNTLDEVKIDAEPGTSVVPIVSGSLVAVKVQKTVYGYSAETGAWDRVELPDRSSAEPVVHSSTIGIRVDSTQYIFGKNSKHWIGVDLKNGERKRIPR